MKQKVNFLLATFFIATSVVFFACQKDVQKEPLSASNSSDASVHAITAPYTSITFNPDPGQVGQDFTASVSSGCSPLVLNFIDQSTGNPTSISMSPAISMT